MMKDYAGWEPSRFHWRNGVLRPIISKSAFGAGSWLMLKMVARMYTRLIPTYAKGALVDLGCGRAPFYEAYSQYCSTSTRVDWSNSPHPLDYIDLYADLRERLPLEAESFDTVLMSDVLEHIPNPSALISEVHRILRPGGGIVLNVPFLYWLHEEPYDYYRYTTFGLAHLLESNNFTVREIEPVGGGLLLFGDVVGKYVGKVPFIGWPIALLIQRVVYAWWMILENASIGRRSTQKMPLAYFLYAEKA